MNIDYNNIREGFTQHGFGPEEIKERLEFIMKLDNTLPEEDHEDRAKKHFVLDTVIRGHAYDTPSMNRVIAEYLVGNIPNSPYANALKESLISDLETYFSSAPVDSEHELGLPSELRAAYNDRVNDEVAIDKLRKLSSSDTGFYDLATSLKRNATIQKKCPGTYISETERNKFKTLMNTNEAIFNERIRTLVEDVSRSEKINNMKSLTRIVM